VNSCRESNEEKTQEREVVGVQRGG
jgi:hypothetical protein